MVEHQAKLHSTHCEPRDKVFNTTEILEAILECLPAKTLFVVQRVNKRFHETIADSPRIQRKMFLRIDNDHSIVWFSQYMGPNNWRFKQVPAGSKRSRGLVTPVVHNPCLELVRGPGNRYLKALGDGGEDLRISCRQTYSFQQFEQQSIGKGFFSDPQCTTVQTTLSFKLGLIAKITVRAIIESDTPLTIAEVVSRTLGSDGKLSVLWLHQFPSTSGEVFREGLPRDLINELKNQTGLEVVFNSAKSTFRLWHVLVPTDEEIVAATTNEIEG